MPIRAIRLHLLSLLMELRLAPHIMRPSACMLCWPAALKRQGGCTSWRADRFLHSPAQAEAAAHASLLAHAANPLVALPAVAAAVLAMLVYGACLALGSIAFKWTLAGRVGPGIHRWRRCPVHV